MDRLKLLAAELFGYSFANYEEHLGIGNERYERLMPETVQTLETAEREGWSVSQIAAELEVDMARTEQLLDALARARDVVDAANPAEAFRHGVRLSIMDALEEGLGNVSDLHFPREYAILTPSRKGGQHGAHPGALSPLPKRSGYQRR